jgi:hypothetical protein
MAEDLTRAEPSVREDAQPEAEPAPRPKPRPLDAAVHAARFRLAYAVLAVVLGAAVGALIVLTGRAGTGGGGASWSSWKPDGSSSDRTQAIANYVPGQYRLEDGRQLVAVSVARPPTVGSGARPVAVRWVALANGPNQSDIQVMPADNTVAYAMCGLRPPNCAIREGQPTVERGQLLRREAFELALYTFKYVDGVDSVVTFLPPKLRKRPQYALFFEKSDDYVENALSRPLRSTLSAQTELTPSTLRAHDADLVSRLVDPHVFRYSFNQAGDGSVYLALQPLPL